MVPAFDQAAFALKPGEISDVVTTAVRLPHHQGDRAARRRRPCRSRRSSRRSSEFLTEQKKQQRADSFIDDAEEEGEDRGPGLNEEVLAAAADALKRGEAVALVTVVRANGSTPQRAGAKMLVFADGRTVGTIGGGCYENDAFWKAREAIATGRPSLAPLRAQRRLRAGERAGLRRTDGRPHRSARARPRASTSSAPATSAGTSASSPPTPASASTSSTTARSSPTPSAFPRPPRSSSSRFPSGCIAAELPPSAYVVVVTRGHHARPRRHARAGRPRPQVSRPDRQPRQGRAHLRRARWPKACRRSAWRACTRRSASTSAPSLPRRSRSASSPS